jgi:hypothetical protein
MWPKHAEHVQAVLLVIEETGNDLYVHQ